MKYECGHGQQEKCTLFEFTEWAQGFVTTYCACVCKPCIPVVTQTLCISICIRDRTSLLQ